MLLLFADHQIKTHQNKLMNEKSVNVPTIVAEDSLPNQTLDRLRHLGCDVVTSHANRNAMFETIQLAEATLGGGNSGRFWFKKKQPIADALTALATVLSILSQSDREFSDVLSDAVD